MKIQYAYIQIGDQVFFQPRNKYTGEEIIYEGEEFNIAAIGEPDEYETRLYLNGSESNRSYNVTNIPIERFKRYLTVLKHINGE